jgi:hypothetical protein
VKQRAGLVGQSGQLGGRLHGAGHVVGGHHRDEPGGGSQRRGECLGRHDTFGAYGQVGHLDALALEEPARLQHGRVLEGARDHVPGPLHGAQSAEHREVVRFGAAGGEDDLRRPSAEQGGHLAASGLDGVMGLPPRPMQARGIAEHAVEIGLHGVTHARVEGRGRGVIQVDVVGHAHCPR